MSHNASTMADAKRISGFGFEWFLRTESGGTRFNALKVFDIVFVVGSAETNGTEVIAERMIRWFFISANDGRAAAIAVVLFLAIIPVMIWNVRRFREQEATR